VGRGITYYNFTNDQFTGFHGIVIPGTLRALFLLAGLLEQQTSLQPQEIMTDTAGYSDVVFGLFWLLGYQFSPRLADIGEARYWRSIQLPITGFMTRELRSCQNSSYSISNIGNVRTLFYHSQDSKIVRNYHKCYPECDCERFYC
jgi:TnpA family transposase